MKDLLEINEFFVEGNDQERSHVLLHITEPGTPEERAKGYFFALAEINNGSLEQIEHLQQMIDDLESGYYETDDTEEKNSFETTLEYINRRGHHLTQYKNSLINFLVGVLRGHELFLSYHGSPEAQLFYLENQEFQSMNILSGQEENNNPQQLFSSILQGTLNDGDYFYLATPHVTDYFTTDRVLKILSGRNCRQSASHIQKVLKELNTDVSFGGLLLHYPDKKELTLSEQKFLNLETGSVASLNRLIGQEQTTADILSSPLPSMVKKKWRNAFSLWQESRKNKKLNKTQAKRRKEIESTKHGNIETNYRPPQTEPDESILNNLLIGLGKALVGGTIWIFNFLKKTFIYIGKTLIFLFLFITNKNNRRQDVVREFRNFWLKKIEKFEEMTFVSKLILLATILLALLFLGSLTAFKIKEYRDNQKLAYENTLQAITDKKTAAEASLLYGDETKAFTLLQEAQSLTNALPQKNNDEKNTVTNLTTEIENSLMRLRKLEKINPELVLDLTTLNSQAKANKLAIIDNQIIAFGAEDNNLYKTDAFGKQTEKKEFTSNYHLTTASTPKEQNIIIFANGSEQIAFYNKDSSTLSSKEITFPLNNTLISTLFVYNQRLYTVDINNNQIYRHNPTQTGFDKGTSWLKDSNLDLKDAVSIAIDGDLFLLKKNGQIFKLVSGNQVEFNITGLDPRLDNPVQLWTYNGVDYLYILEPTNKRIVILDKNGKLIKQYTSDLWLQPTSLLVQPDQKNIYILDNNKIYKFNF